MRRCSIGRRRSEQPHRNVDYRLPRRPPLLVGDNVRRNIHAGAEPGSAGQDAGAAHRYVRDHGRHSLQLLPLAGSSLRNRLASSSPDRCEQAAAALE